MTVKITPNGKGTPPGKLAEAEVHFEDGYFQGLKLVGFAIWERRSGNGRNVTFPARSYSVNGERRSFALLRPIVDSTAQESRAAFRRPLCGERSGDESARHRPLPGRPVARHRDRARARRTTATPVPWRRGAPVCAFERKQLAIDDYALTNAGHCTGDAPRRQGGRSAAPRPRTLASIQTRR